MRFLKTERKKHIFLFLFLFLFFLLAANERAFALKAPAILEKGLEARSPQTAQAPPPPHVASLEESPFPEFAGRAGLPFNSPHAASLERIPLNPSEEILPTKEELLNMLASGEAVVSKAVIFKDSKPLCFIDTVNKKELAPGFARPAAHSSIAFEEDFPVCGAGTESRLASLTAGMAPEGTQMALWPVVATGGMVGCLIGTVAGGMIYMDNKDDPPLYPPIKENDRVAISAISFVAGVTMTLFEESLPKGLPLSKMVSEVATKAGVGGASGIVGAAICGSFAVYLLESVGGD